MRISIITPSFQSLPWLKLCVPSVADQGVELEHIVQDSCSPDGTAEWLAHQQVQACIEKDRGMYDAVNRGLRKARGEIVAYLNCDEQYLPGALNTVLTYFDENPGVEVAFADAVIVDANGNYLCNREALIPHRYHGMVSQNLAILTCATFFRRSIFETRGIFFDPELKDVGDGEWVDKLLLNRVKMGLLKSFTSTFTVTGDNMNLRPNAIREKAALRNGAPWWAQRFRSLLILQHRLRRMAAGHYSPRPFTYSLYTMESPARRVTKEVKAPTGQWVSWPPPA